ncbi:Serine/threonine protein kinase [Trema orientale]|uniref:non-specific serine/threonine protein kinase n=1 Tax=Trema orientale TaxID=63057 RepID=A0A2P5EN03_TREOI|nr:Serine/threonine protein kinase [Trema orientale]
MNNNSLFYIWIATLLCFLLDDSVKSALDARYEACAPRNCGTGPNISFPFYVEGGGADYCGLRVFRIACQENKPIFRTARGPYIVNDIWHQNQSFRLVNMDVVGATCVAPKHSFSFDFDRGVSFSFGSSHANIQFFYGCRSKSFDLGVEKCLVPCASSNSTHLSFVALVTNDDDLQTTYRVSMQYCESQVAVPVDLDEYWKANETLQTVNYTKLLTDGFTVLWYGSESDRCVGRKRSGGRCGFQDGGTVCFCPDGPRPVSCSTGTNGTSSEHGNGVLAAAANNSAASVAGVGILLIVILCCLRKNSSFLFWKKQSQTHQNVEAFLKDYGPLQVRRYSYLDIKKMTNSFTEKLGHGGFGEVYKGKLENGCLVAVKILNDSRDDDGEEFINEVATISRTSHVNVVTLLGFCFEGPNRALVYEFMPNGSLEKFIFDESPIEKRCHPLGWEMLYQISLGIARGLEYLHRGCNARILHFDIKPHNILLDADFVPKITDFGLAKIFTRKESLISSIMGPRGTAGYIAPEIFSRSFGGVSHKSDVYSYGMMVLDMVGGRNNVNIKSENTSDIYFPHWIYKRLELNEELGLERIMSEEDQVKVKKMIMVSLWCIQIAPAERPSMSEVIEMLDGSLNSLPIPPKPFLSSPSRSSANASTTFFSFSEI